MSFPLRVTPRNQMALIQLGTRDTVWMLDVPVLTSDVSKEAISDFFSCVLRAETRPDVLGGSDICVVALCDLGIQVSVVVAIDCQGGVRAQC